MKKAALLLLTLFVLSDTAQAQEADVRRLMAGFLTALQNLDWPALRGWAVNPVMYGPENATRIDGPSFKSTWRLQFSRMREAAAARGITSAPYTKIDPQDMRIDFPGPTVAVVTFHLTNAIRTSPRGAVVGRRMFVVAKTAS